MLQFAIKFSKIIKFSNLQNFKIFSGLFCKNNLCQMSTKSPHSSNISILVSAILQYAWRSISQQQMLVCELGVPNTKTDENISLFSCCNFRKFNCRTINLNVLYLWLQLFHSSTNFLYWLDWIYRIYLNLH